METSETKTPGFSTEIKGHTAETTTATTRALYLLDPVLFVRQELHESPSEDQIEFLRSCANLDNVYHVVAAGRGAGKTKCIAWLVAWSVAILPDLFGFYECVILGGSGEQSKIVYNYFKSYIFQTPFLQNKLDGEVTRSETKFKDAKVKALAASEKQVRGPHPDLLVIDEAMEAEDDIIYSALMQESGPGHGRVVMLSTPHRQSGLFREYWEKAGEFDYIPHGPWPLTRCPWISEKKLAHWKKTLPPEKYKAEVLGEFAGSTLNVFDREDILAAFNHGRFDLDPNYPTKTGIDWGFSVSKTVFLPGQVKGKTLYIPGPEYVFEHIRYPKVMKWAREKYFTRYAGEVYADGSHQGEIQRLEEIHGTDVYAVFFSKHKLHLTEVIETLLFQRRIIISDDNVTLKEELLAHCRDVKDKIIKKKDDTVDALRCLCYYMVKDNLDVLEQDPEEEAEEESEWMPFLCQ